MGVLKKVFILFFLSLTACTPFFSNQEIESDCFPKYISNPLDIFSSLSSDSDAFLWLLTHGGDDNNTFLTKNDIKGFLMPENITRSMDHIDNTVEVSFTGRVFKLWPNWADYNIGGGRKNLNLEVSIKGKQYLLMEQFINIDLKLNLSKRCLFSE
ncbi:MAG: hypothetical protein ACI9N9_002439 [Enterobacterales bacterium]|jgi:hypothetical protein